jgi:hypothetical protein
MADSAISGVPAGFVDWTTIDDDAVRQMFSVSKSDVLKQEAKEKAERQKKRAAKKPHA